MLSNESSKASVTVHFETFNCRWQKQKMMMKAKVERRPDHGAEQRADEDIIDETTSSNSLPVQGVDPIEPCELI